MNVKAIKDYYPAGTRVVLQHTDDKYAPPCGMTGTVTFVDDVGQIHTAWDNGSSFALVYGEDDFDRI